MQGKTMTFLTINACSEVVGRVDLLGQESGSKSGLLFLGSTQLPEKARDPHRGVFVHAAQDNKPVNRKTGPTTASHRVGTPDMYRETGSLCFCSQILSWAARTPAHLTSPSCCHHHTPSCTIDQKSKTLNPGRGGWSGMPPFLAPE